MKRFLIACFASAAVITIISLILSVGTSRQPVHAAQPSDKELFSSFYKTIMQRATVMDNLYKPFADAAAKKDVFNALKIALKIKDQFNQGWSGIYNMSIPDLANQDAAKELKDAKNMLADAYYCKYDIIKHVANVSDNGLSMKDMAIISNDGDEAQTATIGAVAKFFDIGMKLGIKTDDLSAMAKQ